MAQIGAAPPSDTGLVDISIIVRTTDSAQVGSQRRPGIDSSYGDGFRDAGSSCSVLGFTPAIWR